MSFLDSLKSGVSRAVGSVTDEISRLKNKDVLDAVVGASVIVAAADGDISADEKKKLLAVLKGSELTKVYSVDEVIAAFKKHEDRFDFGVDVGKMDALRIIGKQRGNVDAARMIIRVTIMIGQADGNFDPDEKAAVSEIARELGQNPADFGL